MTNKLSELELVKLEQHSLVRELRNAEALLLNEKQRNLELEKEIFKLKIEVQESVSQMINNDRRSLEGRKKAESGQYDSFINSIRKKYGLKKDSRFGFHPETGEILED